ncbi:NAD(P)/FAD-dependent oxidoreductase [Geothrix sp. PMB-07]|uniref:NAD(P)/FAD-dependent oxidoreductase n=1 Tax=Geothrix sp. PMB-07 TaxID=3068640 RepID=UPI0027418EA8|nr:NAD(P)/FAD-dependent oxidoreductase [Geothrix sp. PMB-07]WLT30850.1 NAD(P)/FAD-dependent oxidoreductase [Geothrix sp. PMB-07]
MERVGCILIGAGVVGLALARRLAQTGREVLVLEAAERIGTGVSSRNSEVIHAGIYYPAGSWKAKLCVAGNRALYAYCAAKGIAHRRCGKLIVATTQAEVATLRNLQARATANGTVPLQWLSQAEAQALEPQLRCTAALLSPSTGIVDSHGLMRALALDAEAAGAQIVCHSPVLGGRSTPEGLLLQVGGPEPMELLAEQVINSAGLGAIDLAWAVAGARPESLPPKPKLWARGNYFALAGPAPFSHLVYPVPVPGALGVHLTLDLAGQARFGPDLEWIDHLDYDVNPARSEGFYAEVRRYWPGLPEGALQPAYTGIRPKLHGPGEASPDFLIQGEAQHGVPGLLNLLGIESPGLTAALALAEAVATAPSR